MEDKNLSFLTHFQELRLRVIISLACVASACAGMYFFSPSILDNFIKPAGNLVFIHPGEAFWANVALAFWAGLAVSLPVIFFQIWKFISSALRSSEKKYVLLFGVMSLLLFIGGGLLGYFLILPISIKFLFAFGSDSLVPMISVGNYIGFAGGLIFIFGSVFQLPLIIVFLTKISLIKPKTLSDRRREVVLVIFITAAFFTPPDVITQMLMAGPLLILYEVSIILSKLVVSPKGSADKERSNRVKDEN
ncbi:MAG: twin-arginine translocase subunit TatC [Candidatus Omnitrophica bacterium]|nr:twin-arginine translocase subunit TatC [Candidatus Omnitrophota bacterium]